MGSEGKVISIEKLVHTFEHESELLLSSRSSGHLLLLIIDSDVKFGICFDHTCEWLCALLPMHFGCFNVNLVCMTKDTGSGAQ